MSTVPFMVNLVRELQADLLPVLPMHNDFGVGIHPWEIFRTQRHHLPSSVVGHRRHAPYDRWRRAMRNSSSAAANKLLGPLIGGVVDFDVDSSGLMEPTSPALGGGAAAVIGSDGFQVCIDASQFKPNELTVKTVDQCIIVEGRHEEREDDHGLVQRHFVRKYTLPKGYDPKEVVSTISSDGVLTVTGPPPPVESIKQTERIVQIQHTGPAHLSVKPPLAEPKASKKDAATATVATAAAAAAAAATTTTTVSAKTSNGDNKEVAPTAQTPTVAVDGESNAAAK